MHKNNIALATTLIAQEMVDTIRKTHANKSVLHQSKEEIHQIQLTPTLKKSALIHRVLLRMVFRFQSHVLDKVQVSIVQI